ncbi:putative tyrosyl-DNA phosphodiesterase [Podospora australis]|uniref:Tyrosyl-DNA phosphodiesterase n=1 Tax=Podospora australis TaxID=1536484 RepID=A0AAN6X7G1_9PEZI|nr:putative tyrosyl-DNA phosphodiesterase [Podospora australis]
MNLDPKTIMDSSSKRSAPGDDDGVAESPSGRHTNSTPLSLTHPISPPLKKRRLVNAEELEDKDHDTRTTPRQTFRSPFQLTKIKDLPAELNKDTYTLKDILGDPLISECWEFNYLHDIDFLMAAFDEDVRHLVKVHVVHGFWKREDPSRQQLQEDASRYKNVELHAAFLPEMFGTHHSKMFILLRHDATAEVIIHTGNLIARDWTNMTQGAWFSPRLPLLKPGQVEAQEPQIGNGAKFKIDFLNYLRAYDTKRPTCKGIINQLVKYDFSSVKGSLIASVPGRHPISPDDSIKTTQFGWAAMKSALKAIPVHETQPEIAVQISSIATLGPTDTWLKSTFFASLAGGKPQTPRRSTAQPSFKVVFPTPDEIRKSLDGYSSGGSIHTKIQSAQQAKQLQYLRPIFHHWANDSSDGVPLDHPQAKQHVSGRNRAAPHIKTYIRFYSPPSASQTSSSSSSSSSGAGNQQQQQTKRIDWALLTSANLSKQAWGDSPSSSSSSSSSTIRISSYEIGVLVWPALYSSSDKDTTAAASAIMEPVFLTDHHHLDHNDKAEATTTTTTTTSPTPPTIIPLRMPYNLPLQRYGPSETPWVATATHTEPDWMGRTWER